MSRHSMALAGVGLLLFAIMAVGCNRGVSDENYARVKAGMTYDEVVGILGKPDNVSGGGGEVNGIGGSGKFAVWQKDGRKITVTFVNDKVTVKTISGNERS